MSTPLSQIHKSMNAPKNGFYGKHVDWEIHQSIGNVLIH